MELKTGFALAIARTPRKVAIVDGNNRPTYDQWAKRVYSLADSLRRLGVKRGDRLLIGLKNREETVSAIMATLVIGGVAVPYNPRSGGEIVAHFIRDAGAVGIFFEASTQSASREALSKSDGCGIRISCAMVPGDVEIDGAYALEELISSGNPEEPGEAVSGQDLAFLFYTSGTTSLPKGVAVNHEQSIARVMFLATNHGLPYGQHHHIAGIMPLYHKVGAYSCWLTAVIYNGTYFPVPDFIPENVIALVEREAITHVFASPTHFYMLVNSPSFCAQKMKSVRDALYAGAPMRTDLARRCAEQITENFTHIYGNTETCNSGFYRNALTKPQALVDGMSHLTRIVKFGGCPEDLCKPREEGELIISMRSPESFSGYWNNADETARRCRDGWYFTGDSAFCEPDGIWYVTGRVDDIIRSGGENIHPEEVEQALLKHPGVIEAVVVGIQDDKWGQAVKAFVVSTKDGVTEKELDEFCLQSTLDNWKRPKKYKFVDEIPRNPSGKVLRRVLRQMD